MLLEAIYEQDFYDGSYGFRQGRSPHEALHVLRQQCMTEGIGWIVDADVSGYFDSIDRTRRVRCCASGSRGGILRLIGKWLRAGVMEEGALTHPETGVVQGGVISPVPQISSSIMFSMHGLKARYGPGCRAAALTFADDFVIGCEREEDAHKIMAVLPKRFGRFGCTRRRRR